jgi:hypothetical protein
MSEVYEFKKADGLLITYGEIDGEAGDPIMRDEKRLEAVAALFVNHGPALRDVLEVMLATSNDYLNSSASEAQFVPLRHEMAAFADVWRKVQAYATEHKKRKDASAADKAREEAAKRGEAVQDDVAKSSV